MGDTPNEDRALTASVLYVDDTDETDATVSYFRDDCPEIAVDTVTDVPAAQRALAAQSYDCVVVDPEVGDREPCAVATALADAAPEMPLFGYTAVDVATLSSETLSALTTVVQKGEPIHRRFLATKIFGILSAEEEADRTRYGELSDRFADEQVGIFLRDGDGQVVYSNVTFEQFFGAEQTGGPFPAQLERTFDNGTALRQRLDAAATHDEMVSGYVCERDGEYYAYWSLPTERYRIDVFRPATDIIDRRQELEKLEMLVELAHDGLYTTSPAGRIEYCNEAYAEMLGYDHDELVGKSLYEVLAEGSLREGQRLVQRGIENPDHPSEIIDIEHRRKDGERVVFATRNATLSRTDGPFGGVVNVARDVTGRKERERKLREQREQLRAENARLERIADLVGEDFRDPLQAAETTLQRAASGDSEALDRLGQHLDSIRQQIDEILELAREQTDYSTDELDAFITSTIEGRFEPESMEGPADYYLAHGDADGPLSETADECESTTSETTPMTGGTDEETRLRVLYVDGDDRARERIADTVEAEPDIELEGVGSADVARDRLAAGSFGCLVVDFETIDAGLEAFERTISTAAPGTPLVVFTNQRANELYDRFVEGGAPVVKKGGQQNRAFLLQKVRSVADVGQLGEGDIPWLTNRIETTGTDDQLLAVFVDGDTVRETTQDVSEFFGTDRITERDFHATLGETLVNGEQFERWQQHTEQQGAFLCELPDEDAFVLCWREPLPDNVDAGVLELYRDVTGEVDRLDRFRRAKTLVENAHDGIEVLDRNAEVVYCNETFANFFGYDREELLGRNLTQHFEPESLRRGQQAVQDMIENPEIEYVVQDLTHRTRSGEQFTLSYNYTLTPLDGDGSYTGIVCVARDVTEQKEHERELRRREIELRRKNELLENFAAVLSHELRNPLTIARNHLELARRRDDGQHIETVQNALDRMQELVDELLAFVRMGSEIEQRQSVSVGRLARQCWGALEADEATLQVEFEGQCTVEADKERLETLFDSLFRNAIQHGGEDVTVRVGSSGDGFYVADDGPGIPPQDRDAVFDFTYSAEKECGLGLIVVRDVVHAHGWDIEVGESAGNGARFDITGI